MPLFGSDAERARVDLVLRQIPSHRRRNQVQIGSMTNEDFRWWILSEASQSIRDSVITDVTWWEERHTVLKHQFIILRFEHTESGGSKSAYVVRLERAGKAIISLTRPAIDKATISVSSPLMGHKFFDDYKLLFGLLNHPDTVPPPSVDPNGEPPPTDFSHRPGAHPIHESEASIGGAEEPSTDSGSFTSRKRTNEETFHYDAFVDFLDHKWRGPPPKLLDVAQYLDTILQQNARYSLASTNCFWYARLLMHTIALRHYSFPTLGSTTEASKYVIPRTSSNSHYGTRRVSETQWKRHDPSSISLLFRYLHYEEWRNGILMYRRLVLIIAAILCLGIGAATGYGLFWLYRVADPTLSKGGTIVGIVFIGLTAMAIIPPSLWGLFERL
ncbi:hypothetical protein B0H13DRAFT_312149 [Mycena leptocephala]|nr:hypothetical protein B0H13DRAFT_312149 [Mycena leptocephala]